MVLLENLFLKNKYNNIYIQVKDNALNNKINKLITFLKKAGHDEHETLEDYLKRWDSEESRLEGLKVKTKDIQSVIERLEEDRRSYLEAKPLEDLEDVRKMKELAESRGDLAQENYEMARELTTTLESHPAYVFPEEYQLGELEPWRRPADHKHGQGMGTILERTRRQHEDSSFRMTYDHMEDILRNLKDKASYYISDKRYHDQHRWPKSNWSMGMRVLREKESYKELINAKTLLEEYLFNLTKVNLNLDIKNYNANDPNPKFLEFKTRNSELGDLVFSLDVERFINQEVMSFQLYYHGDSKAIGHIVLFSRGTLHKGWDNLELQITVKSIKEFLKTIGLNKMAENLAYYGLYEQEELIERQLEEFLLNKFDLNYIQTSFGDRVFDARNEVSLTISKTDKIFEIIKLFL